MRGYPCGLPEFTGPTAPYDRFLQQPKLSVVAPPPVDDDETIDLGEVEKVQGRVSTGGILAVLGGTPLRSSAVAFDNYLDSEDDAESCHRRSPPRAVSHVLPSVACRSDAESESDLDLPEGCFDCGEGALRARGRFSEAMAELAKCCDDSVAAFVLDSEFDYESNAVGKTKKPKSLDELRVI